MKNNNQQQHIPCIKTSFSTLSGFGLILIMMIGCNNVQSDKFIVKSDSLPLGQKVTTDQLLYAYKFPKSDFEPNWNAYKNEKKVIFQYQFDPALGSPNFKLLAYITNHVDYCRSCTPFTLSPSGTGTEFNTTNLILGNLDLDWKAIVQLIKKGNDIDPDFDHIYLEPGMNNNYLFYHVSLRKADGSIFKYFPVISPADSTITATWELYDANPSPPAKPNE